MKKKLAIILVQVLLLMMVTVGGAQADDLPNYKWSLSCEYSADNHQTKALEDAAAIISEKTDGHIQITVYPNMVLGDYTVVYGQVMTNDIQIAACPISTQYDPRADVMVLPFLSGGFDEFAENYFEGSYLWELYDKITSDGGVKLLGFFNAGFMGLGSKTVDQEDFAHLTDGASTKSMLMRCPGSFVYSDTMVALGYNTTTIPYSDLYSALQSGLCDGWLGGSGLVNYDGFRDAIKYFVDCNVINESIPVTMNAELFESLSPEYQTIVSEAFNEMQIRVNEERKAQEAQALVDLEAYGITVIVPTADELAALGSTVRASVWPKMAESLGQDIIDEVCKVYNVQLP